MKKKEKIFYIIIILCFITLSLIVGSRHEPWADEAHAWLIARDTSFYTLFFKYLHTDGHPALWHLILKFFQWIGFKYENFYIISTFFSSIGISIFLFKSKFKWYIKLLLPFSYFLIYQYTVVARGYCLVFMLLSFIAWLWERRVSKCYLFTFFLILLLSSESYTFFLAGMIYLIYIYDYMKQRKNIDNKKSFLVCLITLGVFFILTVLYVYPVSTNTFLAEGTSFYISDSFITKHNITDTVKIFLSISIMFLIFIIYLKDFGLKKYFQLCFLLVPMLLFLCFKYCNVWHLGIFFLAFIFVIWIQKGINSKILNIFLVVCLIIQISWSYSSMKYDYNNVYCSSYDVANFIKEYDYNNLDIYGTSFYDSAVNAYFDKNIFDNWNDDIGFFYWNVGNKYYDESIRDKQYDIIVVSDLHMNNFINLGYPVNDKYNSYYFEGYSYVENYKYEPLGTTVYVLKEIDSFK